MIKPAPGGIVIVRAGIGKAIDRVVVGEEAVFRISAETKLENFHSRKTKTIPKRFNVRRDDTEVLSDDW